MRLIDGLGRDFTDLFPWWTEPSVFPSQDLPAPPLCFEEWRFDDLVSLKRFDTAQSPIPKTLCSITLSPPSEGQVDANVQILLHDINLDQAVEQLQQVVDHLKSFTEDHQ